MKSYLATSILGLMIVVGSAQAAEPNHQRVKLYEFEFKCEFRGDEHNGQRGDYRADAEVFAWVDPDDWMTTLQSDRRVQNDFRVRRNDELVYRGGAFLDPDHRFVSITAIGGDPKLVVERRDHESLAAPGDGREYEAFLRVRGNDVRGSCEVRNRPVDEHLVDSTLAQ